MPSFNNVQLMIDAMVAHVVIVPEDEPDVPHRLVDTPLAEALRHRFVCQRCGEDFEISLYALRRSVVTAEPEARQRVDVFCEYMATYDGRQRLLESMHAAGYQPPPPPCNVPPPGWVCTRGRGHDGPCAAHQVNPSSTGTMYGFSEPEFVGRMPPRVDIPVTPFTQVPITGFERIPARMGVTVLGPDPPRASMGDGSERYPSRFERDEPL